MSYQCFLSDPLPASAVVGHHLSDNLGTLRSSRGNQPENKATAKNGVKNKQFLSTENQFIFASDLLFMIDSTGCNVG